MRILIAEDHALVCGGLAALLGSQPGFEVVAAAADGREAVAQALAHRPDLALLDVNMPGLDGAEAAHQIRTQLPATRILAVSMYAGGCFVRRMVDAGASGYVLKDAEPAELIEAVQRVGAGGRWFSRGLGLDGPHCADPEARLSRREREVLRLLALGRPLAEIAADLDLSVKTVETYRRRLMGKLAIEHVPGLVAYALRQGYLTLDQIAGGG